MIVTDSNGGESNCEDLLGASDRISVLKQQVTNSQLTQEKEAKKDYIATNII